MDNLIDWKKMRSNHLQIQDMHYNEEWKQRENNVEVPDTLYPHKMRQSGGATEFHILASGSMQRENVSIVISLEMVFRRVDSLDC